MTKKDKILKQINKEINDIEYAMACDDSISSFSLSFAQAEERLNYLNKIKKQYETKG